MLKIGWLSAAAYATTGYGKVTKEICSRLINMGLEVYNIGGAGGQTVWGGRLTYYNIPVLPVFGDIAGKDVLRTYIREYDLDIIISLWDSFVISYLQDLDIPSIMYIPIDTYLTKKMINYFKDATRIVAMSKFGYMQLIKSLPSYKIRYIPHGVNTDYYYPRDEEMNAKTRAKLGVPEDAFLIINVSTNFGERKQLPLLLKIFSLFSQDKDDVYLYLFTNPSIVYPRGHDLVGFCKEYGIEDKVIFPTMDPILNSWSDIQMADLYSCADLYLSTSLGEGFGLPILEAQACGTPVVAPFNSTMPELVEGHGWLYDCLCEDIYTFIPVWIPTLQEYPVPSVESAVLTLEEAYNNTEKREEYSKKSAEFAKQYDYEKIIKDWIILLNEFVI